MGKYICKRCGKEFNQKSHYDKHMKRKRPCKDKTVVIEKLVEKKVEEEIEKLVPQFGQLSKTLTKNLDKESKKKQGIFFTPYNIIKKAIDIVIDYTSNQNISIIDVLEPSCGSCEFIKYINHQFYNINIDGIEFNDKIYNTIKDIKFSLENNVNLIHMDYLKYNNNKLYDLIFGNPPYFVMKKNEVDKEYNKYYDGRPNIFIIFIIHSLFKLKENGILLFVLPKSFCNCLYYNKLRNHINHNYKIIDIIDCSNEKYLDTSQDTIIFIMQNKKGDNNDFVYENNGCVLFNTRDNINIIKELYKDTTTLEKLNFNVKVGNTVWNQCKDILTDNDEYTRLIYSGDIKGNKLDITEYKNKEKKNYIKSEGIKNPIIVVNRGYGIGTYNFNYCIVNINKEYLIENHLIIIEYKGKIDEKELLEKFKSIKESFENEKTKKFIELYCCNSALNCTELHKVLPIYI
tara:strand:+ start:1792 stop:3165 length:1374 start_codon:yes stop_codon:yes gene_type:complete